MANCRTVRNNRQLLFKNVTQGVNTRKKEKIQNIIIEIVKERDLNTTKY